MRQAIVISIISLFTSFSFGQLKEDNSDYLFHAHTIFEISILNNLLESKNLNDSIQIIEVNQSFHDPNKSGGFSSFPIYPLDNNKIQKKVDEIQKNHIQDSIIFVHREKVNYTINSTTNKIEYPSEWEIKMNRNNKRIKTINSKYLKAQFEYDAMGKLTKIKFQYTNKVKTPYYEGKTSYIQFEYENDRLFSCYEYGIYGSPNLYIFNYY